MLNHKIYHPVVPPVHLSAEWIAHNAAMAEKRKLLSGPRPVIGCAYRAKPTPSPAVYVPRSRARLRVMKVVKDTLSLVGFVTIMGAIMSVGTAVGF